MNNEMKNQLELEEISLISDDSQPAAAQAVKIYVGPEIYEVDGELLPFDNQIAYL